MLECKNDKHSNNGKKALAFCLMNRFLFVSKVPLAYVMNPMEDLKRKLL